MPLSNTHIPMNNLCFLFKRARRIYQTEGFKSLLSRVFAFAVKRLFEYRSVWLQAYELENIGQMDEASLMPRISDFTFAIVRTNQEADELEAGGFEFRSYPFFVNTRRALDRGAIAFCIFVERELASIAWSAMSKEAKDSLGEGNARVDFSNNEAWTGGVWTNPKYRRMGMYTYRCFKMRQFLLNNGATVQRSQVSKNNRLSLSAATKTDDIAYGEGRYLKILWWKSWKERPITSRLQEGNAEHNVSLRRAVQKSAANLPD